MRMQTREAVTGWSWLCTGFGAATQHAGRAFGAAVLLTLCMAVLAVGQIQLLVRGWASLAAAPHTSFLLLAAVAVIILASGVINPILYGGFMRMLDAGHNDRPASAWSVFAPFRPGGGGLRLALFGLLMLVTYLVFSAIVSSLFGRALLPAYIPLIEQMKAGAISPTSPALFAGMGLPYALGAVFFLFYSAAFAIGAGQVALRNRSPWSGFCDGIAGAFKNVLPLAVLALCALGVLIVACIGLAIIVVISVLIGHAIGFPTGAGLVLSGLFFVACLLVLVTVMMGINYAVWRDVAGATPSDALSAPVSGAQA